MPWYRIDGRAVHFRMAESKAPLHCRAPVNGKPCCGMSTALCDWPVGDEGHTCSMPICREHANQVGKDLHYCPKHLKESKNDRH